MNDNGGFSKKFKSILRLQNKLLSMYSHTRTEKNSIATVYGGYDYSSLRRKLLSECESLYSCIESFDEDEGVLYFLYLYGVILERYFKFDEARKLYEIVFSRGKSHYDAAGERLAVLAFRRGDESEANKLCAKINAEKMRLGYPVSLLINLDKIRESAALGTGPERL